MVDHKVYVQAANSLIREVEMAETTPNPFDGLAIETVQHIATYLDCDLDICRFRSICRSTNAAVDGDGLSFWRRRFLATFDKPTWLHKDSAVFRDQYQVRKWLLKHGARTRFGETKNEKHCLELVKALMCEAFPEEKHHDTTKSLNFDHILRFLCANDLLKTVFRPMKGKQQHTRATSLLQTIQVLCAPLLLSDEPALSNYHFGFPDSQLIVYSTTNDCPIFTGCQGMDINMALVLHNLNFWKYHMIRAQEQTLYPAFAELLPTERPRWWTTQLKQGEHKLGRKWKGSYAYLDRETIEELRVGRIGSDQVQDSFAGDTAYEFQDLTLDLADPKVNEVTWPREFERILKSLTVPSSRAKTRAQKRAADPDTITNFKPQSFRFEGEGQDVAEAFLAAGWLNVLPPQSGVPGWQRMTMMKYFCDEETGQIDTNALWAYEGVVLPGGQIMVGRWWSPDEDAEEGEMYSGPYILWCVD